MQFLPYPYVYCQVCVTSLWGQILSKLLSCTFKMKQILNKWGKHTGMYDMIYWCAVAVSG